MSLESIANIVDLIIKYVPTILFILIISNFAQIDYNNISEDVEIKKDYSETVHYNP